LIALITIALCVPKRVAYTNMGKMVVMGKSAFNTPRFNEHDIGTCTNNVVAKLRAINYSFLITTFSNTQC